MKTFDRWLSIISMTIIGAMIAFAFLASFFNLVFNGRTHIGGYQNYYMDGAGDR